MCGRGGRRSDHGPDCGVARERLRCICQFVVQVRGLWNDIRWEHLSDQGVGLSEAKAKGLGKYINTATYKQSVPPALPKTTAVKAIKAPSGGVHPMASGCWSFTMGYHIGNNMMWGKGDVTWCGGGTWVTYNSSNCYGGSWYRTYNYEGCEHYPNYGKGWSLYQVKNTWNFCIVYAPLWGSCVSHQYPWEQYQFTGGGQVLWNGGW